MHMEAGGGGISSHIFFVTKAAGFREENKGIIF